MFQADQICYAVLCVFSYVAAGQEQSGGKQAHSHGTHPPGQMVQTPLLPQQQPNQPQSIPVPRQPSEGMQGPGTPSVPAQSQPRPGAPSHGLLRHGTPHPVQPPGSPPKHPVSIHIYFITDDYISIDIQ